MTFDIIKLNYLIGCHGVLAPTASIAGQGNSMISISLNTLSSLKDRVFLLWIIMRALTEREGMR